MQMPNFACVSQINGPLASLAQFKLRQLKIMDLKYLDFLPLYLQIIQNILNWYFGLSMDIMFTYCVLLASNGTCAWCILCSTFKWSMKYCMIRFQFLITFKTYQSKIFIFTTAVQIHHSQECQTSNSQIYLFKNPYIVSFKFTRP